jgi:transaldolase/transaldolase/glucose-6-phosphate isomerase
VGTTALDNARAVYLRFRELCATDRWAGLAECGARVQRPLWASTGTKNALFEDTLYVDNLIGRDTVNTLPMNTLQAFLDHGVAQDTLGGNLSRALERRAQLAQMGIDLGAVTGKLLEEGLAAFESPYRDLIYSISAKQTRYETENREGR